MNDKQERAKVTELLDELQDIAWDRHGWADPGRRKQQLYFALDVLGWELVAYQKNRRREVAGKRLGKYGPFRLHILDSGDLRIRVEDPETLTDLRLEYGIKAAENAISERDEFEVFEPIWTNGLDYFTADQIGALSERPCFGDLYRYPERVGYLIRCDLDKQRAEGKLPIVYEFADVDWDHSRVWGYGNYQLRSPLNDLLDEGYVDFELAEEN